MFELRKTQITIEEIHHDGGPRLERPLLRGSVAAVFRNPFAGRYASEAEFAEAMDALKPLGLEMSKKLIQALGGDPRRIEAYGKGSIVGANGEFEQGALWHVPGGYAMRELLGNAKAIVPSSKKMGTIGTALDVPIHHINAAYVRGHFSAMEVRVPDAPKADEIVFCLVMTTGGRPHDRMGGLKAADINGEDGLR
jgi:hypothetical protein